MPLLSIITITFNAEKFIEPTLESISRQSSRDFEYIIVDGASKDGTLEKINNWKDRVDQLVSEPDKGIYDAMNKGLKMAKGDYVWFMNAGDEIAEADTVEKLLQILSQGPDIVYSDTWMLNADRQIIGLRSEVTPHQLPETLTWQKFKQGMLVSHQSFIVKKEIAPAFIENNLSADIDWEINSLKRADKVKLFPGILSKYLLGGISNQRKMESLWGRYKVLQSHFGFFPNLFNHFKILIRAAFK